MEKHFVDSRFYALRKIFAKKMLMKIFDLNYEFNKNPCFRTRLITLDLSNKILHT